MQTKEFYSQWAEWFAKPMEEKMLLSRKAKLGGYYEPGSESPGFTGKPDPKEYYHFKLFDQSVPPELADVTEDVFMECLSQADRWLQERGLHDVEWAVRSSDCVLRIIHYPATEDGCVGEAHRDFDLLTVNVGGTVPGLQVAISNAVCPANIPDHDCAHWIQSEGGVHVGEMLEIYTAANEGREDMPFAQPATTHRVQTAPNTERFAAVLFYLPPMEFELRPGFTARDYLLGPNGVLKKAGTKP